MTIVTAATFDVHPETVDVRLDRRGIRSDFTAGMVQRRQVMSSASRHTGQQKVRTWTLGWNNARWQDVLRIDEAWNVSIFGAVPLSWTPPDAGAAIAVKMLAASFDARRRTTNSYSAQVDLEEVL